MILEKFDEILVKKPEYLKKAKKKYEKYQLHINGVGVTNFLSKIESFENEQQVELRRKLAKSTRFIFNTLLRPFDKVFSAKGGNSQLNTRQDDKFRDILSDIVDGMSLRKWLQNVWSNKYLSDPNGIIFLEWGEEIYPTYVPITSIRNYHTTGNKVDWVVFEPVKNTESWMTPDVEYVRIVDAAFDYIFTLKDNKLAQVKDQTFANPLNTCPAFTCSDLIDDVLPIKTSAVDGTMEVADEVLLDMSVHSIYKKFHAFPLYWQIDIDCQYCRGSGVVDGERCQACGGSGVDKKRDVSKMFGVKEPMDGEQLINPVAGYIVPPADVTATQNEEIDRLIKQMTQATWGTQRKDDATDETATARWLDVQPVNDRLNSFTDSAELLENEIVYLVGLFYGFYNETDRPSISYGRRYLIETADQIWTKYETARKEGAPESTLSYHLLQFYQTEFANDTIQLTIYTKLMKVEPFVHYSIDQITGKVNDSEYKRKVYYNEWLSTLKQDDILSKDAQKLREELTEYSNNKESLITKDNGNTRFEPETVLGV